MRFEFTHGFSWMGFRCSMLNRFRTSVGRCNYCRLKLSQTEDRLWLWSGHTDNGPQTSLMSFFEYYGLLSSYIVYSLLSYHCWNWLSCYHFVIFIFHVQELDLLVGTLYCYNVIACNIFLVFNYYNYYLK